MVYIKLKYWKDFSLYFVDIGLNNCYGRGDVKVCSVDRGILNFIYI